MMQLEIAGRRLRGWLNEMHFLSVDSQRYKKKDSFSKASFSNFLAPLFLPLEKHAFRLRLRSAGRVRHRIISHDVRFRGASCDLTDVISPSFSSRMLRTPKFFLDIFFTNIRTHI